MPFLNEAQLLDLELRYDSHSQLTTEAGELVWDCRDCGRLWTGTQQGHCAGCHLHFSSDSAFEEHVVAPSAYGPRPFKTCKTQDELMDGGRLTIHESKYGRLWGWPGMAQEAVSARRASAERGSR